MSGFLLADVRHVCDVLENVCVSPESDTLFFFFPVAAVTQFLDMPTARLQGQIWLQLAPRNYISFSKVLQPLGLPALRGQRAICKQCLKFTKKKTNR